MIKNINESEINILKKRLNEIIRVKKMLSEKKLIKDKLYLKGFIKNRKIVPENQVDSFIDKGNILLINSIKNDELNNLREKFTDIISIKKELSTDKIRSFNKEILSFNDAVKVFLAISGSKLISIENKTQIFSSYLRKSNLLDKNLFNKFEECTFDYINDYGDEEMEAYDDVDIEGRIEEIITSICKKIGIETEHERYSDIIFNLDDIDYEYKELSESSKCIYEDYIDSDDPVSDFTESYGEDAIVYIFKGIKLSQRIIDIVNINAPSNVYGGFRTEMFTMGNNTFLTLSDYFFCDPIDINFALSVICSLVEGGKFKC